MRPLDAEAARAAMKSVKAPSAKFIAAVREGYESYRRVFEKMYGDVGCARPVSVGAR
jgi:hypothetical protein